MLFLSLLFWTSLLSWVLVQCKPYRLGTTKRPTWFLPNRFMRDCITFVTIIPPVAILWQLCYPARDILLAVSDRLVLVTDSWVSSTPASLSEVISLYYFLLLISLLVYYFIEFYFKNSLKPTYWPPLVFVETHQVPSFWTVFDRFDDTMDTHNHKIIRNPNFL